MILLTYNYVKNGCGPMYYEKITSQIKQVQEQQDRNQEDMRQHDQIEQNIHELNGKGKRWLNELSDTWGKEQRMDVEVDQNKNELLYNERRIRFELEEKKESLLKEKRELYDLEEELFTKRKQYVKKEEEK